MCLWRTSLMEKLSLGTPPADVRMEAQAYRLPLLPPYLADPYEGREYTKGVNFAVAGATALDVSDLLSKNIRPLTNHSLSVQLGWFDRLLPSLCSTKAECHEYLRSSLFLVGEIGGNDYNYAFFQGMSIEKVKPYVHDVVTAIANGVNTLIKHGAMQLMVPGNLPIGCISLYLTIFSSRNLSDYDPKIGCLKHYNEFAVYHNSYLLGTLKRLREQHPHARIIYADYYTAAMSFFKNPKKYGFESALRACCGDGEPYNFNSKVLCGQKGIKACDDPSRYVNWDGIHLTDKAYNLMANGLLSGRFAHPVPLTPQSCN
ncbi:GDSL esterase/lipase At1g28600-like isoform X2 [Nymphaea colorata]|uniref:GDSL esterase/lipase At1g28600-like isoform X2 n=1 Tax=Nymphaea colorata TaxID=210225 RepID=UPI00214E71EA|nr:GDSL esterase/lipase At1g28600-like isoform X2 [Nymphaea colorata]